MSGPHKMDYLECIQSTLIPLLQLGPAQTPTEDLVQAHNNRKQTCQPINVCDVVNDDPAFTDPVSGWPPVSRSWFARLCCEGSDPFGRFDDFISGNPSTCAIPGSIEFSSMSAESKQQY